MALTALIGFNVLSSVASLLLLVIGLGVIFGLMRIINLAHGEFLMLGAYATVLSVHAGVNIWLAILVVAPVFVGLFGILVERALIRFLYGRMIDTMLATWGLSLGLIGIVTSIFGTTVRGVSAPLGSFEIGSYHASVYSAFTIAVAALTVLGLWAVLKMTRFGLIVRATMQNPAMAAALGVTPGRVYMVTFGIGAALTGLAGGVIAPVAGVAPGMGAAYVAKARRQRSRDRQRASESGSMERSTTYVPRRPSRERVPHKATPMFAGKACFCQASTRPRPI